MRFALIQTITVGATKHHIVEAFIENAPEDTKNTDAVEALGSSKYAANYSERGIFLANRKIVTDSRIPKDADTTEAISIEWKTLAARGSVQFNLRVPAPDKAGWDLAAARVGLSVTDWARQVLNEKAKG
ncbi:hypothetical protein [Embleya sp. NPDC005575]|uniref:hypothetical protein n=1 Tax=Embleya sp. NPDC005575 TaxID=3156892 RepID=UPI0033BE604E